MNALTVLQPLCCRPGGRPMPAKAAERVAIVNRLSTTEAVCVCDLTSAFELSQPTISHHLRILRDAGLVESERHGTWAYYRLVPDAIDNLRAALGADERTPA